MGTWPGGITAITLFVEDLAATRRFYEEVFQLPVDLEDPSSVVFRFGTTIVNLLAVTEAPELVAPAAVGGPQAGTRFQLTLEVDDVDAACAAAATHLRRSYVWPYQMHASIGPSCAVADFSDGRLTVWTGTQNPHMLRADLNRLLRLGEDRIELVRLEAAGCYGRNCADDVCADAALLSIAVGVPMRARMVMARASRSGLRWPEGSGRSSSRIASMRDLASADGLCCSASRSSGSVARPIRRSSREAASRWVKSSWSSWARS